MKNGGTIFSDFVFDQVNDFYVHFNTMLDFSVAVMRFWFSHGVYEKQEIEMGTMIYHIVKKGQCTDLLSLLDQFCGNCIYTKRSNSYNR